MADLQSGRRWLTAEECAAVDAMAADGQPNAEQRAYDLLVTLAKAGRARARDERLERDARERDALRVRD